MPTAAIDLGEQIDAFGRAAERFFDGLADIGWGWLVVALILSLGIHLCRGHAWANALRAALSRGERERARGPRRVPGRSPG